MTSSRKSIEIPGLAHGAPIPMGSRIGNITFSSAIMGMDPETGEVPDDPPTQVRLVFENVRRYLAAAGMSVDDIIKMTIFLANNSLRSLINDEWNQMFPDAASRPARHILEKPQYYMLIIEVIAVAA